MVACLADVSSERSSVSVAAGAQERVETVRYFRSDWGSMRYRVLAIQPFLADLGALFSNSSVAEMKSQAALRDFGGIYLELLSRILIGTKKC